MKKLLRSVFALLYGPFAWTYDWVAAFVSCGRWKDWTQQTLPYLPGPCVVELGHGPGHLQIELRKRNIASFGVDPSPQMGRIARRSMRRAGYSAAILTGYAQCIALTNACCDQVVATFPSDYIFDRNTLQEVHRILKPGGSLVVLLGGWLTGDRLCQRLLGWLLRGPAAGELNRPAHWLALLSQAGFATQSLLLDLPDSRVLLILARRD